MRIKQAQVNKNIKATKIFYLTLSEGFKLLLWFWFCFCCCYVEFALVIILKLELHS